MKMHQRILSGILTGTLAMLMVAPAAAAGAQDAAVGSKDVTGSIQATLRLDYEQKRSELAKRNVTMTLKNGNVKVGAVNFGNGTIDQGLSGYDVQFTARNSDGGDNGANEWPAYLDVVIGGLAQGDYTLSFSGTGYTPFEQSVKLDDYSQAVVLGTSDQTFGLGDVNGDGKVDEKDKEEITQVLGTTETQNIQKYDLSGDGVVDITDLAYVSRQCYAEGGAQVYQTAILNPQVDYSVITNSVDIINGATAQDLFLDNGAAVKLRAKDDGDITIPITMSNPQEMSVIKIATPDGAGKIEKGTVTVEDKDGNKKTYQFDNTMPADMYAISRNGSGGVITIDLGNRVAVKKVTVSVTKTDVGYAVVDSIEFLKDIVPENPVPANSKVKTVYATEGDGEVALKWGELPNVSGYKVTYALKNGGTTSEVHTEDSFVVIDNLENLKTYVFRVTPTSEGWTGIESDPIEATPQPAAAPDAPDMVNVKAGDGQLHVSWKKSKTATSYEVYYTENKDAAPSSYIQADGGVVQTNATISNLTNGKPYYVYVVAVNEVGKSAPSKIATGTPVAVDYKEPLGLPKDLPRVPRENIASIVLNDSGNYSSTGTMPFTTDYLVDGDYRTNWTSQSYGDGNALRSKKVTYTFNKPVDMNNLVYVPRADGYENNMRLYGITVWCKNDDPNGKGTELVVMDGKNRTPIQGKMGNAEDGYFVVLPFPATKDIVKIAVDIEQTAYSAVGISEVIFFEYDETKALDAKIDALFADPAHTKLVAGVDQAKIQELSAALEGNEGYYFNPDVMKDELKLASELAAGTNKDVILNGIDSRSSAEDAAKYHQGGSDFQPLGVAAKAGQTITVYAENIPENESVTVWATQSHAEAAAWQASMGTLKNGRNVLTVPTIGAQSTPRGGSLYVTYNGANGKDIILHSRLATDVPVLELGDWYTLNDDVKNARISAYVTELASYAKTIPAQEKQDNCLNVTEISLPTVLLSLPATAVWDSISRGGAAETTLHQSVEAWEQVMHIAKTTQGIDKTYADNDMTSRQNIRYMQMFAGAFMYAAGSHIGVEYGSCGGLVNGKPVNGADTGSLYGWGIAHEIGHNMDKLGKAEITNNIYPLMVQTFDGQDNTGISRLESSGTYEKIFTKVAQARPGASNDVFVQLGMYWQLHLAYDGKKDDVKGPLSFYNQFFKEWKAGSQFNEDDSYDDKVALTASFVANEDLTDFFTHWGMQLSERTKNTLAAKYTKSDKAIWYLNDQSRRDRLANKPAGSGTINASAAKTDEKTVTLTLSNNLTSGDLQGYEIMRNGKVVGFTKENTFVDQIGSANNMNFAYTVQAYDTLGNAIGAPVNAGDVRIAYDKVVDPSKYDVVMEGTTAKVTVKDEAIPVSGIKLTGGSWQTSDAYTVTVTADDKSVIAKNGTFDVNDSVTPDSSYIAYFNKPGTSDTRIWTYDVKTLEMANVPAGAKLELISYAEDDIAFMQDAAVGVLEQDYQYGPGTDDMISAGTLVITGTYRGDPVYNTLRIKGDFTSSTLKEDGTQEIKNEERYLDGYGLLFAEIPDDGKVSDISDGIFIFVPDVQNEAELQGAESHCTATNLLPTRMMAEFYRTDDPSDTSNMRMTASSSWIYSPGGDELPTIQLQGGK